MEKEFIPYEQALALKELGFDEPCFTYYKNNQLSEVLELVNNSDMRNVNNEVDDYISAPTFSQAFRWFREKYGLDSAILENRYVIETKEDLPNWYYGFKTYEESELACLLKLIGIVKIKYSSNDAPTWYN